MENKNMGNNNAKLKFNKGLVGIIAAAVVLVIVGVVVDNRGKSASMDMDMSTPSATTSAMDTMSMATSSVPASTTPSQITVTKGAPSTSILTSNNAAVLVVTPNGGETWVAGTYEPIGWRIWERTLILSTFDVSMVPKPGSCIYPQPCATGPVVIAKNVNDATSTWQVGSTPGLPVGQYKAKVCFSGTNICDMSDNYFTIIATATSSPNCPANYSWNGSVCTAQSPVMPRN